MTTPLRLQSSSCIRGVQVSPLCSNRPGAEGWRVAWPKFQDKLIDTSLLTEEVNMEFARAMNKITFDYSMLWRHMPELQIFLAPLNEEYIAEPTPQPRLYVLTSAVPFL